MEILILLVGIIGILAGGIVNILADDLPLRRNPGRPVYPDGTPRPPLAWLGITAFLFGLRSSSEEWQNQFDEAEKEVRGRKYGGTPTLSWRYPLTEILTAALMVLTILATKDSIHVSPPQIIFWLIYMPIFVLITVIDIEHKLILFVVIIPTAILALLDAVLVPKLYSPDLRNALIGGAIGFGVFFIMYNGGFLFTYIMGKIRGKEIGTVAFGYGDVMLGTVSGLMLGFGSIILALFITIFLGAFGAFVYLIGRSLVGRRYSMFTALPYGPYIVIATIIMLIFRTQAQFALLGYCNPGPC